ncbi:unnamed protein product, partial [Choristocarpus tenellus]
RPPPKATAPVYNVSVTRWRFVDANGVPCSHGGPAISDNWTEVSSLADTSSRAATISRSEIDATPLLPTPSHTLPNMSAAVKPWCPSPLDMRGTSGALEGGAHGVGSMNQGPLGVQFELAVHASGQGEMDWWGHGSAVVEHQSPSLNIFPFGGGSGGSMRIRGGGLNGEWRVWRSGSDALTLYDSLALQFGQDFCIRVKRPLLRTVRHSAAEGVAGVSGPDPSNLLVQTAPVPHRSDTSHDAKSLGAFLRHLLGQRQFLSTEIREFLGHRQVQHAPLDLPSSHFSSGDSDFTTATSVEDGVSEVNSDVDDRGSKCSGDNPDNSGLSTTKLQLEADDRRLGKNGEVVHSWGRPGGGGSVEAVAAAALATDYTAWLTRLAVRLRRAVPAGECFVRLRCIDRAITGEQVVRWLVSSCGDCKGNRTEAVRLGSEMVSCGLLLPICAGYEGSNSGGSNSNG